MFRIKESSLKVLKQPLLRIFLLFTILFSLLITNLSFNQFYVSNNNDNKNLKSSAIWGWINFTNYQINQSEYYHDQTFRIKGRLFYLPFNISYSGYTVNLVVDGSPTSDNNVTDNHGRFEIDYTVPTSGNIYVSHVFEAEVTNPGGQVKLLNYFLFFYRTTCFFNISEPLSSKIPGEDFEFNGDLRYYSGSVITDTFVDYYWYDGVLLIQSGFTYVDPSGYISNVPIPDIPDADELSLRLSYSSPQVDYSETTISDPKVFTNITCDWSLPINIYEQRDFVIAGQVLSQDGLMVISNRIVHIFYNNTYITSVSTNTNGDFSYTYKLPTGIGIASLGILLDNGLGKNIFTSQFINIEAAPSGGLPGDYSGAPFLLFLSIFLPILGTAIAGLVFYGYRYYKRQDKLSKVVNLPLESKIINLKILKDSGRLEESLSYLFNAIYMDLVNAKYGRTRKINETIRDFAIISVKDLKLNPTAIYPFIQKIEQIIYAKPFQITENDFYNTVELFSPIYLQLTGYNFVLNF